MHTDKISIYKTKLLEEKKLLQGELPTVGSHDSKSDLDWQASTAGEEVETADRNMLADEINDFETKTGIMSNLETRLFEVDHALSKIESGSAFGICEIGGEEIEEDRLDANPAARTCKKHINDKP